MIRSLMTAAAVAALTAGTVFASDTTVSSVNVTADVSAIANERAAVFWVNIADDLQGAILARLVDKLGDDGATINVDVRELALANAFERSFNIADAVLVAQVNVSHPSDNTVFNSYELSLTLGSSYVTDAEGKVISITGVDTPEAYQTLVDRFADNVVERLN